jgi:hypothetical protein
MQPYYAGPAYGASWSAYQPWSYSSSYSAPVVPYAVAPVRFSLSQPAAPGDCSSSFSAESYGVIETLTLVKAILDVFGRPDRPAPPADDDPVSEECRKFEARLKHIEEHLKKGGGFTPHEGSGGAGHSDPSVPGGADPRPTGASAHSQPASEVAAELQDLKTKVASMEQKLGDLNATLTDISSDLRELKVARRATP